MKTLFKNSVIEIEESESGELNITTDFKENKPEDEKKQALELLIRLKDNPEKLQKELNRRWLRDHIDQYDTHISIKMTQEEICRNEDILNIKAGILRKALEEIDKAKTERVESIIKDQNQEKGRKIKGCVLALIVLIFIFLVSLGNAGWWIGALFWWILAMLFLMLLTGK